MASTLTRKQVAALARALERRGQSLPSVGTCVRFAKGVEVCRTRKGYHATPRLLPLLSEAEHAEYAAVAAVTKALLSRDPTAIARAKRAYARANEATAQAWARLPAQERLRRREAGDLPWGL